MTEEKKKVIEKLAKIKALAERGVGGEKATAQQMYEALKSKYGISDEEVKRAETPQMDITQIDLKRHWGLSFQLATTAANLQEEMGLCNTCKTTYNNDCCYEECGTFWNIRELQQQFEIIQQRLIKAAMEV